MTKREKPYREMSPEERVRKNPKVVPLSILRAVLEYSWRAYGRDGQFMSDDDFAYMVEQVHLSDPATSADLLRFADEFVMDDPHQETLYAALVYLGYEVYGRDRRIVQYLKVPEFKPRDVFNDHPYEGIFGSLGGQPEKETNTKKLDEIADHIKAIQNILKPTMTDDERIEEIKKLAGNVADKKKLGFELYKIAVAVGK